MYNNCAFYFRSPTESKKRHEEKQAKAQELRDRLMQEKSERLRELGKKVRSVNVNAINNSTPTQILSNFVYIIQVLRKTINLFLNYSTHSSRVLKYLKIDKLPELQKMLCSNSAPFKMEFRCFFPNFDIIVHYN